MSLLAKKILEDIRELTEGARDVIIKWRNDGPHGQWAIHVKREGESWRMAESYTLEVAVAIMLLELREEPYSIGGVVVKDK